MKLLTIRNVIESLIIPAVALVIVPPLLALVMHIACSRYTGQEGWDEEDVAIYNRRMANGEWTYQE